MKIEPETPDKQPPSFSSFNSRIISLAEDFDQLTTKRHSELSGKVLREFKIMNRNLSWSKWNRLAQTLFASSADLISQSFGKTISESKRIREENVEEKVQSGGDNVNETEENKENAAGDKDKVKKSRKLSKQSLRLLTKCLLAVNLIPTSPEVSKKLLLQLLFESEELKNRPELEELSGYLLYRYLYTFSEEISQSFLMIKLREYQIQKAYSLVGIVYNHALRRMLLKNYIEEAGHFISNCEFPEHEQNIQLCKFLFYKGYYMGLTGNLRQSGLLLGQALQKAPESYLKSESRSTKNFKLLTQKHLIVVSLLQSESPPRKLFRDPRLAKYKQLVLLVSKGHFKKFRDHLEQCQEQFKRDLVFPLLLKLKSVVIKNGLKKLSQAYSSLSVIELMFKLGLHNEKKLEVDAFLAKVMSKMNRFTLDSSLKTVIFKRETRALSDDSVREALARRVEHVKSLEEQMVRALKFPEEKEEQEKPENEEEDEFDLDDLDFSFEDFF
jgi:hypothetical protein